MIIKTPNPDAAPASAPEMAQFNESTAQQVPGVPTYPPGKGAEHSFSTSSMGMTQSSYGGSGSGYGTSQSGSLSNRTLDAVPPPSMPGIAGAPIRLASMPPPPQYSAIPSAPTPAPPAPAPPAASTSSSGTVAPPIIPARLRDPSDKGAKQLIVKFLAPQVTEQELRALFQQFGPVEYSRMIYDNNTGASKGYGFVYYYRSADAAEAVSKMDSFELYGRYLRVGFAIPQRQPPSPPPLPSSKPIAPQ